jgi:hypothetical protein
MLHCAPNLSEITPLNRTYCYLGLRAGRTVEPRLEGSVRMSGPPRPVANTYDAQRCRARNVMPAKAELRSMLRRRQRLHFVSFAAHAPNRLGA